MTMSFGGHLEKIAREEGIKNLADIYDTATFEEILGEIEKKSPNIEEMINESMLDQEEHRLLTLVRSFCTELSREYQQEFTAMLEEYRNERRQISHPIIDYLSKKHFDLPEFVIAHGEDGQYLLDTTGMGGHMERGEFLVVFQLPKPLAHFWWKGGYGENRKDMEGAAIEWGHFYGTLMPVVWDMQGFYENEKGLDFERINEVGQHDPKNYYYIWQIRSWNER